VGGSWLWRTVMQAVVLLSGGIDSTVCAVLAVKTFGAEQIAALNVLYGQKHANESEAARAVAERLSLGAFEEVTPCPNLYSRALAQALLMPV